MSEQLSVEELMKAYGYTFKGSCHCDGYETWTWKKDTFYLSWRKRRATVRIIQGRTTILKWTSVVELASHLKILHGTIHEPQAQKLSR